jgi:hypothetical protein
VAAQVDLCTICLNAPANSYAHVPPAKAFNKDRVVELSGQDAIFGFRRGAKPLFKQGGSGRYTSCRTCNSNVGSWYDTEYIRLARAVKTHLSLSEAIARFSVRVKPLRLYKSIIACFLNVCGHEFSASNKTLGDFVLQKSAQTFPPSFSLYGYAIHPDRPSSRQSGITFLHDLKNGLGSKFSEFAHFPLGFILTHQSPTPTSILTKMDYLRAYTSDCEVLLPMTLPLHHVVHPYPADFRTFV